MIDHRFTDVSCLIFVKRSQTTKYENWSNIFDSSLSCRLADSKAALEKNYDFIVGYNLVFQRLHIPPSSFEETKCFSPLTRKDSILWGNLPSVTAKDS